MVARCCVCLPVSAANLSALLGLLTWEETVLMRPHRRGSPAG